MVDKLILIGENHLDLDKASRYQRVFGQFKPDVITLELTEYRLLDIFYEHRRNVDQYAVNLTNNIRAALDMNCGMYFAAKRYCKDVEGVQIRFLDENIENVDIIFKKSKDFDNCHNFSQQELIARFGGSMALYYGLGTAGRAYLPKKESLELSDILMAFEKMVYRGTKKQLQSAQQWMDSVYLLPISEDDDGSNLASRNSNMIEKIKQEKGTVVHLCGFNHIFSPTENLFDLSVAAGIATERYKLLDFCNNSKARNEDYLDELKPKLEKIERAVLEELH